MGGFWIEPDYQNRGGQAGLDAQERGKDGGAPVCDRLGAFASRLACVATFASDIRGFLTV